MEVVRAIQFFFYVTSTLFIELYCYTVKVNTNQGEIIGVKEITIFKEQCYFAFYGVPYAMAPVGRLRFQNPKPLKRFNKPFDASIDYHGACAQAHIIHKQALYGQEDCLHLNIYTPHLFEVENGSLKPVIVWIHGYAFTSSFSHVYGPDFIIESDTLFISLTHRIGVFGFLKFNESDSNVNMGLRDIVIGLKWIRKNIQYFGGDKNKITLMCSGSGGTLSSLLLLTKNRKLFQKLIIQGSSIFSPSLLQGEGNLDRYKLEKYMKTEGYKEYFTAPADVLVAASNKIYSSKDTIDQQRPLVPFAPIIEKKSRKSLVSSQDLEEYEKRKNDNFNIPVLTGFASQESITEVIPFIHNPSYLKSFGKHFKYMVPFSYGCSYNSTTNIYKKIANLIIRRYFKNYPDIALEEFLKYTSDLQTYPIYKFIKTQKKHSKRNLFVYKFNYSGKFNVMKSTSLAGTNIRVKGSAHGDEICYILKCEPLWENYIKIKNDIHDKDRMFMNNIVTMWTNFAKYGNPTPSNDNGNITWPPMTLKEDNILLFGKKNNSIINSRSEAKMYKFWNRLYEDYYMPKHCSNVNKAHDEL